MFLMHNVNQINYTPPRIRIGIFFLNNMKITTKPNYICNNKNLIYLSEFEGSVGIIFGNYIDIYETKEKIRYIFIEPSKIDL
jgi:hypothetical protein